MRFNIAQYLPSAVDPHSEKVSPLFARDLQGLPNALILTAGSDPMRDEAETFGRRLAQSGTEVFAVRYPGTVHGFFLLNGVLDDGAAAIDEIGHWLRPRR